MATFLVDIQGYSPTTAWLSASFTGGDPEYSNRRRCKIEVKLDSTVVGTYGVLDNGEYVGDTSVFDAEFGSFSSGTTYSYTCILQYKTGSTWYDSSYSDTGTFTTEEAYSATVVFDANGGTNPPSGDSWTTETRTRITYTIPSSTPTPPSGKTFSNWLLEGTTSTFSPGDTFRFYTILGGYTYKLIAQYTTSTTYKVTLTFVPNGGTGGPGTKVYNEGDTGVTKVGDYLRFNLPSNTPTAPSGKEFDYWLYSSSHYAPGQQTDWYALGGQSYTLTAQWKDLPTGYKAYICNGTTWEPYTAYICNGTSWEPYTPKICNGSQWE